MTDLISKQKVAKRNKHVYNNLQKESLLSKANHYQKVNKNREFDILRARYKTRGHKKFKAMGITNRSTGDTAVVQGEKFKPEKKTSSKKKNLDIFPLLRGKIDFIRTHKLFIPSVACVIVAVAGLAFSAYIFKVNRTFNSLSLHDDLAIT
ncbi:MAG: hypothetical protein PQJ46_15535, partial [Spirochaetales bacterium]|nr:hypothetical protein [Spirochaetales bacterium]